MVDLYQINLMLFYNILREHSKEAGFYNKIEIADELFKYKLVKDILINLLKDNRENMNKFKLLDESEIIKDITSEISRIKNA